MAITDLQKRRADLVREHMQAENDLDYETVMNTFSHPRYELIGSDTVFDGDARVREYFQISRVPFPDQKNEIIDLHHGEDEIIVELWLRGTHTGPLKTPSGELPPTGRKFEVRLCAIFDFEDEKIVCERVYFDQLTIVSQLTAPRP
ncbi:ester cyclase [uncultured Erythrobacter sp.]|uniref:ester cyclase n=1 Tax=uncultured Erythrobacter sp. TaxID=263913 RepID=UPI00261C599D|nr:ester cyclase [uncultured Erythrobacter sp.]